MSQRLTHFKWVLVDQIADLTTATKAIRDHVKLIEEGSSQFSPYSIYYFRMCSTFLIISLAKLSEALDHYGKEINKFPSPAKNECIAIKEEILKRGIYKFRNKYAAHIFDKETKEPISLTQGEERYKKIVGEDIEAHLKFCDWINPETIDSNQISVMSAILKARDYCLSIVGSNERQ